MSQLQSDHLSKLSTAQRIDLARRAGTYMAPLTFDQAKREAAINVARILVSDLSVQVRETLAFELRSCTDLPKAIACKIACDIDDIAVPFLSITPALTDAWMAELVPLLSDNAHTAIAARTDVGPLTSREIVRHGNERSVTRLLRNESVAIDDTLSCLVQELFPGRIELIDTIAGRHDIPLSVAVDIVDKVSDYFREQLIERYALDTASADLLTRSSAYNVIWQQVAHASPAQIHAQVIDLRAQDKLTFELATAVAERGSMAFLESALAIETGRTLADIRNILRLSDPQRFVGLMREADIDETLAPRVLKLAKHRFARTGLRHVGTPTLWQRRPSAGEGFTPVPA